LLFVLLAVLCQLLQADYESIRSNEKVNISLFFFTILSTSSSQFSTTIHHTLRARLVTSLPIHESMADNLSAQQFLSSILYYRHYSTAVASAEDLAREFCGPLNLGVLLVWHSVRAIEVVVWAGMGRTS
jgi:hypothetical protein